MQKKNQTKTIVVTGLLLSLEIVFQIIGNYLNIGLANINISLVPVVLAAVLCGPMSGAILGFFNGIMALFSHSTIAFFMPVNLPATILVCLLKCTLAGALAGFIFNIIKKKNSLVGLIVASVIVPVVNTGLFSVGALLFFRPLLQGSVDSGKFANIYLSLILGMIGWNFLIEITTTLLLSPTIGMIVLKREEKQS